MRCDNANYWPLKVGVEFDIHRVNEFKAPTTDSLLEIFFSLVFVYRQLTSLLLALVSDDHVLCYPHEIIEDGVSDHKDR